MPSIKRYGWKPDIPDHRDFVYKPPKKRVSKVVDLRPRCPKQIFDQGNLGSCTACALSAAYEFELLRQKSKVIVPSQLFIYYMERVLEGTVKYDAGAMIRTGMKVLKKYGACNYALWPYSDRNPGAFQMKPTAPCYRDAAKHQVLQYSRLNRNLNIMKACIDSGHPFVFGFTVYSNFVSAQVAKTGVASLPSRREFPLGGHAVLAVGYMEGSQRFIVRNSWGAGWGMGGYFTLPYGYFTNPNLSDDFWTMRLVEG